MDTVYAAGILNSQPYKVDGNRIYGPGIADDKGGLAVMMASLKILADAGWRDYDTLTVLMNPDEEVGSVGSGDARVTGVQGNVKVASVASGAVEVEDVRGDLSVGSKRSGSVSHNRIDGRVDVPSDN
jgi:arginine utilization protein RocB